MPKFMISNSINKCLCVFMIFSTKTENSSTKFEGPYRIIKLNLHYAVLPPPKGKPFKRNILHLKAYFPPNSSTPLPSWATLKQGEEAHDANQDANRDNHINQITPLIQFFQLPALLQAQFDCQ